MEKVEGMEPGLNELIQHGYIRIFKADTESQNSQNSQKKRGRPSWIIEVNPIYEALRDGKEPENKQEPAASQDPEPSVNNDPYGWEEGEEIEL